MLTCSLCCCFSFFFFKQKTAYEMRISDCSSDVCSSDLHRETADQPDDREPLALSYRSYLFVPADSPRKLARAAESGADAVILDLEDAVAPANKAAARTGAARFLTQPAPMARFVRVNGLTTKLTEDDVAATAAAGPDGYVLPKCEIGRAHVCTPVTNAHLVFRLLLDKK